MFLLNCCQDFQQPQSLNQALEKEPTLAFEIVAAAPFSPTTSLSLNSFTLFEQISREKLYFTTFFLLVFSLTNVNYLTVTVGSKTCRFSKITAE